MTPCRRDAQGQPIDAPAEVIDVDAEPQEDPWDIPVCYSQLIKARDWNPSQRNLLKGLFTDEVERRTKGKSIPAGTAFSDERDHYSSESLRQGQEEV